MEKGKRIDFIDLAKGFGIMLMILQHTEIYVFGNIGREIDLFTTISWSFYLPFFFTTSGAFYRTEAFRFFLCRKINGLLIPFLFFFLSTSCLYAAIMSYSGLANHIPFNGWRTIFLGIYEEQFYNGPIWFLLCLFFINLWMFIIDKIFKGNVTKIGISTAVIGTVGFILSYYHINLPCFIDSSFTVMPFFAIGMFLRQKTQLLDTRQHNKLSWLIIPTAICLFIYFIPIGRDFYTNRFECNIISFYFFGIIGTLLILFIAKVVKRLPLISYLGRNSLIVLCTHIIILRYIIKGAIYIGTPDYLLLPLAFILTLLASIPIIKFCVKCIPFFCGQKDILKYKKATQTP